MNYMSYKKLFSGYYFHFIYFFIFKLTQKNKQDGQEDAFGKNDVEDRAKYSDCDLMDNRYIYADNKKGKFPKEQTNLEPSERINGCVSEHFDGVSHGEMRNPTY